MISLVSRNSEEENGRSTNVSTEPLIDKTQVLGNPENNQFQTKDDYSGKAEPLDVLVTYSGKNSSNIMEVSHHVLKPDTEIQGNGKFEC